jgi:hypothetical protein
MERQYPTLTDVEIAAAKLNAMLFESTDGP